MHNYFKVYYFIDEFNLKELSNIKIKINIIYRNYNKKDHPNEIIKIRNFCKKRGFRLFLSNNFKLANRLDLDGVYLPAFNKNINLKNLTIKKNFQIIGSAHNISELKIKENQNCKEIFISPLFKTNKTINYLDVVKFNIIAKETNKMIIGLGGINLKNLRKLNLTKSIGVASISWIKKNGLNKNLGRF